MRHRWNWPELLILTAVLASLAIIGKAQWHRLRTATAAAEAVDNLTRIERGAAIYYGTPHQPKWLKAPVDCQFPETTGTTPTGVSCCDAQNDADDDERCDDKPQNWNDATWAALKFRIEGAHFCQYGFLGKGTLAAAQFTAQAEGDADCDGIHSTFSIVGKGDSKAAGPACVFKPGGVIFRDHETE